MEDNPRPFESKEISVRGHEKLELIVGR